MPRETDTAPKVLQLLAQHIAPREIAQRVNISRQRVYQIAKDYKVNVPKHRYVPHQIVPPSSWLKTAAMELIVAIDLLSRGWQVFYPLAPANYVVATNGKMMKKFEVRSGTYRAKAATTADHFAFVVANEPVRYDPAIDPVLESFEF